MLGIRSVMNEKNKVPKCNVYMLWSFLACIALLFSASPSLAGVNTCGGCQATGSCTGGDTVFQPPTGTATGTPFCLAPYPITPGSSACVNGVPHITVSFCKAGKWQSYTQVGTTPGDNCFPTNPCTATTPTTTTTTSSTSTTPTPTPTPSTVPNGSAANSAVQCNNSAGSFFEPVPGPSIGKCVTPQDQTCNTVTTVSGKTECVCNTAQNNLTAPVTPAGKGCSPIPNLTDIFVCPDSACLAATVAPSGSTPPFPDCTIDLTAQCICTNAHTNCPSSNATCPGENCGCPNNDCSSNNCGAGSLNGHCIPCSTQAPCQ